MCCCGNWEIVLADHCSQQPRKWETTYALCSIWVWTKDKEVPGKVKWKEVTTKSTIKLFIGPLVTSSWYFKTHKLETFGQIVQRCGVTSFGTFDENGNESARPRRKCTAPHSSKRNTPKRLAPPWIQFAIKSKPFPALHKLRHKVPWTQSSVEPLLLCSCT